MCFFLGVKSNANLKISLKNHEIDLSGYQPLFKEVQSGFEFAANAVVAFKDDQIQTQTMDWGFAPHYIKSVDALEQMRRGYTDANGKFHPPMDCLNARIENLFTNFYKYAAEDRHCLLPITHFFEWRHIPKTHKTTGKPLKSTDKIPYLIEVKNQEMFWLAGIWQGFTDKNTGEYKETFSLITQPANELMQKIHNTKERMPAIMSNEQAYDFLVNAKGEKDTKDVLSTRYPSEQMNAYTIQKNFKESMEPLAHFEYAAIEAIDNGGMQNGTLF